MYYEQSGSKSFVISFVTSFFVTITLNILFIFLMPNITAKFGNTIEVPNLKGLDVETARQIIESKGLSLIIEKEVEDPIVEKGRIAFQNPLMGSRVKKGDIIKVIVSKGQQATSEEVIIPIITGLTLPQARVRLAEANLTIGKIRMEVSDKPESTVIRSVPQEGEKVPLKFPVELVISSGMGETIVPKITGLTITRARKVLEDNGLTVGKITQISDPEYGFDIVIKQNPIAG